MARVGGAGRGLPPPQVHSPACLPSWILSANAKEMLTKERLCFFFKITAKVWAG